ncbi:hypothetical protein ACFGVR_08715 [Mucilaginibacter sp. AW1-3]
MTNYPALCRIIFAASLIAIAVQQLVCGCFLPVIMPPWGFTHSSGAVAGSSGLLAAMVIRTLWGPRSRKYTLELGYLLLLMFIVFQVSYQLLNNPAFLGGWTNPLKVLAYAGGAFIVVSSLPKTGNSDTNIFEKILPLGRFFFAITLFIFGIEHFVYPAFVATLVPNWIPFHLFWTYFAGLALIAAGLGIMFNFRLRLTANLLGTMLFLWVIVLHIPRAIADPHSGNGNEWTSVFEALGFSAIAFLLAANPARV